MCRKAKFRCILEDGFITLFPWHLRGVGCFGFISSFLWHLQGFGILTSFLWHLQNLRIISRSRRWTFAGPFWLPFSSTMLGRGGDTCWPEQPWSEQPCSPCAAPSPACDMTTSRVPKCMNKTLRLIFLDGRFSWLILCYKRWMLLALLVRNIAWPTCSRPNCAAANHSWLDLLCSLLTAGNSTLIGILIVYHLFGSFCILFWSLNRKWSLSLFLLAFGNMKKDLGFVDVKVFLLQRFRGDLVFWASAWQVLRLYAFTLRQTCKRQRMTKKSIAAYLRSSRSKNGFFVSCTSCTSCKEQVEQVSNINTDLNDLKFKHI